MKKYYVNDLFCGCGGMAVGFKAAGYEIAGAWDIDKFAVATYSINVDENALVKDIKEMHFDDLPCADVWTFGFPCQDVSVAGKGEGLKLSCTMCGHTWKIDQKATEHKCPNCHNSRYQAASRSGLLFEVLRLIDEALADGKKEQLPPVLLAENVKGLTPYLQIVAKEFRRRGYTMHYQLYNTRYWGVPQVRERYYLVFTRDELSINFDFPKQWKECGPLIDYLDKDVPENFFIDDVKAQAIIEQALLKLPALGDVHPCITPRRVDRRQQGRRAKEDQAPMFTLTAQDLHGVIIKTEDGYRVRVLTPTEYGRLQAFPMDTWTQVVSDNQAYKQFGNAVTTKIPEALGRAIIRQILSKL